MITDVTEHILQPETVLPEEISTWYEEYGDRTWKGIDEMIYPTGLPADQLHFKDLDDTELVDKTSPTNIGFYLTSVGAAYSLGLISEKDAQDRIHRTLKTIERMMEDQQVFIPTDQGKGLFVNWIQPSTGKVLSKWPDLNNCEVKQQLSSVDNAWLIASCKLIGAQFPEFQDRIQNIVERTDLLFMLDSESGFFHGCYSVEDVGFEGWEYSVISESRISYLVCGDDIVQLLPKVFNNRTQRSIFFDSNNVPARATYNGEGFSLLWLALFVPEYQLHPHWKSTYLATIQAHRDYGNQYCNGHYGFSAGYSPCGDYYEFRVPSTAENTREYTPTSVITVSTLVNMAIVEPVETYHAIQRLHIEFPGLTHSIYGDGDTVDTASGEIQRGYVFPNKAAALMSCCNVLRNNALQRSFMLAAPSITEEIYRNSPLW